MERAELHTNVVDIWYMTKLLLIWIQYDMMWAMKWSEVNSLSHVQLFGTPWTVAYQASQPMEFFQARETTNIKKLAGF